MLNFIRFLLIRFISVLDLSIRVRLSERMSEYWASLPTIHDTEWGLAAIEREQMTKPRPLDVTGPTLYQPSGTQAQSSPESVV